MRKTLKQTLVAIALAGAFTNANATPVDWTLDSIKFILDADSDFTSKLSGTFTYDADTNTFTNEYLQATYYYQGNFITSHSVPGVITGNANEINFYSFTLYLSGLSNSGGSVSLDGGNFGTAYNLDADQTISGVPRATAVPEPEAYALMLAGLGLVGFAARRKLA